MHPNDTTSAAPAANVRQPVFYLSHGGGPWPFMDGGFRRMFARLEDALKDVPRQLPAPPRALLVISAHWEEPEFTVSTSAAPEMLYDYHGFPDTMYKIRYPAPGAPDVAERAATLIAQAGWAARRDPHRGFDHASFSLLQPIYPDARMPVVQISMRHSLDPAEHFALGQALAPLRDEGVLILGSGQSFHNLRVTGHPARIASESFDN